MESFGHLNHYHHSIIVTDDVRKSTKAWATLFDFREPEIMDPTDSKFDLDLSQFVSRYRNQEWMIDMKQSVLYQEGALLELKQPGTADFQREFLEENGNGMPYFGIVENENFLPFKNRLIQEFHCDLVHDQKYPFPGSWCLLDTRKLLGIAICLKDDGFVGHVEPPVLPAFSEISIVVPNLDDALKNWESMFHVTFSAKESIFTNCYFYGNPSHMKFQMADLSGVLPFKLRLIEPHTEGIFQDYLNTHGQGIHHLCFSESKQKTNLLIRRAVSELPLSIMAEYSIGDKHYTILDSSDLLGCNIAFCTD